LNIGVQYPTHVVPNISGINTHKMISDKRQDYGTSHEDADDPFT